MSYTLPTPTSLPYWSGTLFEVHRRTENGLLLTRRVAGANIWVPAGFNSATDYYVVPEKLAIPYDDGRVFLNQFLVSAFLKCGSASCKYYNTGYGIIMGSPDPGFEPPLTGVDGKYSPFTVKKVLRSDYYLFPANKHVLVPADGIVHLEGDFYTTTVYGFGTHTGRLNSIQRNNHEFALGAPIASF